jgi:hypothetical protein
LLLATARMWELRADARRELARAKRLAVDPAKRAQAIDAARASVAYLAIASDIAARRAEARSR